MTAASGNLGRLAALPKGRYPRAFTLIELLVVVAIIALLVSVLLPSLSAAKEQARAANCLSNLHNLGLAMSSYQAANNDYFWAYSEGGAYFWGKPGQPVDPRASAFLRYCDYRLADLWCPSLPWGTYVPQAGVSEPTTTYGYNAWCLDPQLWGRRDAANNRMTRKKSSDLKPADALFVLADSGMFWKPGGVSIFQNSTSLDPVTTQWGPNATPTTHFRHRQKANALCADGHGASFLHDEGALYVPEFKLGFVGAANAPHYDIE